MSASEESPGPEGDGIVEEQVLPVRLELDSFQKVNVLDVPLKRQAPTLTPLAVTFGLILARSQERF
jgi:hypothetical protein